MIYLRKDPQTLILNAAIATDIRLSVLLFVQIHWIAHITANFVLRLFSPLVTSLHASTVERKLCYLAFDERKFFNWIASVSQHKTWKSYPSVYLLVIFKWSKRAIDFSVRPILSEGMYVIYYLTIFLKWVKYLNSHGFDKLFDISLISFET